MNGSSTDYNWEVIDSIGVLTICSQPENKIGHPEFVLAGQLEKWTDDISVKGLVITGAGRHFSSGADLDMLRKSAGNPEQLSVDILQGNRLLNRLQNLSVPVVAAISGACFGAGLEIALSCHIRICTENSIFAFPESGLGLIPGLGGSSRLLKVTDIETCMQMVLAGEMLDADAARKSGIVHRVVSEKHIKGYCIEYLKRMVGDRPKEVVSSVVKAINNAGSLPFDEALRRETAMFCELAVKNFSS